MQAIAKDLLYDDADRARARRRPKADRPARASHAMRLNLIYFDTSAWNDVVDHAESDAIVAELGSRAVTVFASVISAGEILKTRTADRRERLCAVMLKLHGDVALLERPMTLAAEAARAFLRKERDFSLPCSGPGRSLREFLGRPDTADAFSIAAWLQNLDRNHERFLKEIRPELPDPKTRYYSPELLRTEPFLKLLSTVPAAQELRLSTPQIAKLTAEVDVWRALAGTMGYIITQSTSHSPKTSQGRSRPGGPDMWQVVYLGVAEAFVSGDERLLEAAREVSKTFRYPRCVISTRDFLDGITVLNLKNRCGVCGSSALSGLHAFDPRVATASS
jgi:predicted nucleic acid-binding protein